MTRFTTPLTASADPTREIPAGEASRRDRIEAALGSLAAEEQRLARIGLELPMARCREQRRYWTFLGALFSMTQTAPARHQLRVDFHWPGERSR